MIPIYPAEDAWGLTANLLTYSALFCLPAFASSRHVASSLTAVGAVWVCPTVWGLPGTFVGTPLFFRAGPGETDSVFWLWLVVFLYHPVVVAFLGAWVGNRQRLRAELRRECSPSRGVVETVAVSAIEVGEK